MKSSTSVRFAALLSLSLIAFAAVSRAETTTPADEALRGNVESVDDHRSTMGTNTCMVRLSLIGEDLEDTTFILGARATRAIDDIDRDLVPKTTAGLSRFTVPFTRVPSFSHHVTIQLRTPSRRATSIKALEGTADLYTPTEANDGIVTLSEPLATANVPLKNAVLEKYGIEITYLTEEKAAELRRSAPSRGGLIMGEDVERLTAVADEVNRRRMERESMALEVLPELQTITPTRDSTAATIPSSRATIAIPSRTADGARVTIQVKDPQNKLVAVEWHNGSGTIIRPRLPSYFGSVRSFTFAEPLPSDVRLVAYVASDGAVKPRPFRVENIALP